MQTKPDLRLFKTSFSANEKIQWSFWKISKISVWSFKINNTPLLFFAFCPDVFAEGLSFLQQKQRVSSQKRWGKTIAGLCWHCLKMVWSNSYTMNTSRLTTVRKTIAPSCKWVSLWGNGVGGGHTDIPIFFEKRTHRDHVWLQPMPAAESLVLCSSSDSVTIQSSATFSYCVLASILLAGIETRPLTHTHTHTLSCATAE